MKQKTIGASFPSPIYILSRVSLFSSCAKELQGPFRPFLLFKDFLDLISCKQEIWFVESEKFLLVESAIIPGLLNPEYSSRIRNRTKSLGFPNMGRSTLLKRKDGPLPSRNIRLESQTRRAIYVSTTELYAMAKRKR